MIDLGLNRISKLLKHLNNPQFKYKSIHVAGTNGKGSTLAYISSILTCANIRNGKFTSPHLLDYNDCITINNQTYPQIKFYEKFNYISELNQQLGLKCTEFELLTATAFKIFCDEQIEIALIEVGVGGRLDATNVLEAENLICCGITKISKDHESLLGDTIEKIAFEKAGIVKSGIPVFIDSSNEKSVIDVVRIKAQDQLRVIYPEEKYLRHSPLKGNYQINNLSLAIEMIKSFDISEEDKIKGIKNVNWPGRLQLIETKYGELLIDGAHNENAAMELRKYLDSVYPKSRVFVIGMTKGKNVFNLIKHLVEPDDIVIPITFSQPENMPWIKSESTEKIGQVAKQFCQVRELNILEAFQLNRPIIVCGSLYLCADILREFT